MKYLIFLLLIIFPFGQLLRVPILGNELVFHPNDFIVALILLIKRPELKSPITKPILIWVFAMIFSLLINDFHLTPFLYIIRFTAYAGLFFVFKDLPPDIKIVSRRWMTIGIVIVTVTGLAQYIFLPNVAFLSVVNWDDHYYRLVGTFLDPGFTGAILVLGLLFLLPNRILGSLIYLAMALTYSRASYLMYLVSFGIIAWYKKSLKFFVIAATILVLTIFALPRHPGEGSNLARENSILARVHNWQQSVKVWQTSPIFGIGFNNYRFAVGVDPQSHSGGADSSILLVLATTGTIGLLAYIYLLKRMWSFGGTLFKAGFLGIIIHSFFNNTLFYPWVMEWLWIVLALQPSDFRHDPSPQS